MINMLEKKVFTIRNIRYDFLEDTHLYYRDMLSKYEYRQNELLLIPQAIDFLTDRKNYLLKIASTGHLVSREPYTSPEGMRPPKYSLGQWVMKREFNDTRTPVILLHEPFVIHDIQHELIDSSPGKKSIVYSYSDTTNTYYEYDSEHMEDYPEWIYESHLISLQFAIDSISEKIVELEEALNG